VPCTFRVEDHDRVRARAYDASVRALVVDAEGRPRVEDVREPSADGEVVQVRACGLCGSDIEKLVPRAAGLVLGHEVVAETRDGRRVVLVHHRPCGKCERCRSGHESTCEDFRAATIVPGGFAERAAAVGGFVDVPDEIDDAVATYAEPLACVLRGAERVPPGDVLVLGGGFIGRLFEQVLRRRGDPVHVYDRDPSRSDGDPPGLARSVVLAAPADPLQFVAPGGFVLAFAPAPPLDLERVYRDEIAIAGSRSATPRHLEQAVTLLPGLDLPEPTVLPLGRFEEGLALYRSRRAIKLVFTP
jgi:L-iditol 2-dehydrogenase